MTTPRNADEIREAMQVHRLRMSREAAGVAQNARQLTDWRFYLQEYTGTVMAGVGILGYLMVPGKNKPLADPVALEKLALEKGWVVDKFKVDASAKPGMLQSAMAMASGLLLKAGMSYATRHVGDLLGRLPRQQQDLQTREIDP